MLNIFRKTKKTFRDVSKAYEIKMCLHEQLKDIRKLSAIMCDVYPDDEVVIYASRPGFVIGYHGKLINQIQARLQLIDCDITVRIVETVDLTQEEI